MKQLLIILTAFVALTAMSCGGPKEMVKRDGIQPETKTEKEEYAKYKFEDKFFDAKAEVIKGNYDRALYKLEDALEIYPDNDAAMFEVAKVYLLKKDYVQAEVWTVKATKQAPDNPWYWLQLGEIYKLQKKYNLAGEAFEKGANLYKKQIDYYLDAANSYISAKQYEDCIRVLDSVETRFGVNEQFITPKVNMYKVLGKKELAIKEINKLVALAPNDPHFLSLLGNVYMEFGMNDSALATFNKILETDPYNGAAHASLAELYRLQGDKTKYFNELELMMKDPDFDVSKKLTAIYSLLPQMKLDKDVSTTVGNMADNFYETHPGTSEAFMVKAEVLQMQGKNVEAREFLLKSLEINGDDFNLWNQLLALDEQIGDDEAMLEHSKEAIALFPTQLLPYQTGCVANIKLKKYQAAIDLAEEALVFAIGNKDKAIFYGYMADAYHEMGNHELSDFNYEKVLVADPKNALAMNNYAYYLSVRGENLERAAELSLNSLKIEPNNASYMDTYGWIMFKQGKYAEAEQWIGKALKVEPGSAEVLEHYGDVLFKLGKVDEAVSYWQKAKDAGSTSTDLDKKIANKKLYE